MPVSNGNGDGSAIQKVERARHHLECFEAEVDEFVLGPHKPYEVTVEVKSDGAGNEVEVHTFRTLAQPSLTLSLIAGDTIQNARSALDHLIYQASLAHTPNLSAEQRREAGFPIAKLVRDFNPRQISAIAPDIVTFVEALQPYHGRHPDRHPLAQLRYLANMDKHQTIHLMYAEIGAVALFPGRQMKGPVRLSAPGVGSGPRLLKDGAVITTAVRETPGKMQVTPSPTVRIGFTEGHLWHGRGAVGLLRELVDYVDNTVVRPGLALL